MQRRTYRKLVKHTLHYVLKVATSDFFIYLSSSQDELFLLLRNKNTELKNNNDKLLKENIKLKDDKKDKEKDDDYER